MLMKMYVVFDVKSGAYTQPWFLMKDGVAVRAFSDLCNDSKTNIGAHPEDFTLFCIGSFDDQNAGVDSFAPRSLGNGIEFVKSMVPLAQGLESELPDLFKGDGVGYEAT